MLNTKKYGSGRPLIFVHGFCEDSSMWEGFCEPFIDQHEVFLVDLPGFGKSSLPSKDFTLEEIADQLAQWMKSLKINNAIVIGHSLGGYVILELAKNYPELIEGFGLFHSTAFVDTEEKRDTRNKVIEFVEENGVEVFADSFVPQLFYTKNRKRLATEIEQAVNTARQTPLETLVGYTKAMRDRNDRTDVLKSFDGPVLFIAGDQDTSVPLDKSEKQIPMIQKGVTGILQNTGHMGMFEAKGVSQQLIHEFLSLR
ncbi:MAG: alpha/beta hydrolase [Bacteroidota bacterium]